MRCSSRCSSPLSTDGADAVQSTSFERTDALRTGLLDGLRTV